MYLRYGTYTHRLGEPTVAIHKETIRTDAGQAYAVRELWSITGLLVDQAGNPLTMRSKIAELEAAYAEDYRDIVILLPDGQTESTHKIVSRNTIGGVQVVQRPSFPEGGGAQGVTLRTFAVTVEALVRLDVGPVILAFRELLRFSGGGPRYGHLETLTGLPDRQRLRRMTVYHATQQGHAVGLGAQPAVPLAIWPAAQICAPTIEPGSPQRRGAGYYEFPIAWSYQFESAVRLVGRPHVWTTY